MAKFRYIDDLLKNPTMPCAHPHCQQNGEYRAPKSPANTDEYQFFCLDHIKEFNKKWDYFKGFTQEDIEHFQKDAFTGHRPTWRVNPADHPSEKLEKAFYQFMYGDVVPPPPKRAARIPPKQREALERLEMEHPTSKEAIKKQYKKLVKQYHPDRNPDDKEAEEIFKGITAAYHLLLADYQESIVP